MNETNDSSNSKNVRNSSMYFAVYIPPPVAASPGPSGDSAAGNNPPDSDGGGVYEHLSEAVEIVKKHKYEGARFKSFSTSADAEKYARGELIPDTPIMGDFNGATSVEEGPPFPSLSRPELSGLKRVIDDGDLKKMRELLLQNPRYLVNCSGDTPTIVYAGCRYNALHLAAKSGHLAACQLVLFLINDPDYLNRLYPFCTSPDIASKRKDFLLDLYLNTPDKAANETPLHFASKLGHVEIVELLIGYDLCQKFLTNKYGETPADLACSRAWGNDVEPRKNRIMELLSKNRYFVALYRPQDYTGAPVLRRPVDRKPETTWRPEAAGNAAKFGFNSPALVPELCLAASAGPMSAERAEAFYGEWSRNCQTGSGKGDDTPAHIKRSDLHKGMERVGRKLAAKLEVKWTEYWPFMSCFADFSGDDGLQLLEEFFKKKEGDDSDAICAQLEKLAGAGILKPVQDYTSSPIGKSVESSFREYFSPIVATPGGDENASPVKSKLKFDDDLMGDNGCDDVINGEVMLERQSSSENDVFEDSLSVFESDKGDLTLLAEQFAHLQVTSISDLSGIVLERSYNSVFSSSGKSDESSTERSKTDGSDSVMDEESDDSFETPPSTPPATYLVGKKPTKMDFDVFLALEDVWIGREKDLAQKFPAVAKWCRVMTIFSPQERQEWPGIDSPRAKKEKRPLGAGVTSPLARTGN